MESKPDIEIISHVLKGHSQAYSILVSRYQNYVFTLALHIVGNREDAEEIAQDCFVKAYRSLTDFKGNSKFSTWLYTIVSHTCSTFLRKRKPEIHSLNNEIVFDAINNTAEFQQNILEQKNKTYTINQAIAKLKNEDAEVLTLFYIHEQSLDEIAHILGIEMNAAKVRLHRARQRLRELISKHYVEILE